VAVLGRLEVDGLGQVELLDNDTGAQVEVVADDLDKLIRGLVRGAVGVDVDGEGLGNTNGVRELDKGAAGEAGSDDRLGDPAADVGGRAVDLGEILAGEGTTTVSAPAAVGVDDDLAASETGVTLRATDDKEARGLDLLLSVHAIRIRVPLELTW
jgi:hypothetical protein